MDAQSALFLIFSGVMLVAALRVITARNSVHAVLLLVLAFFSAAALWILLRAEFLAIALVLVYVGAVMVLFLFVVMMLDVNFDSLRRQFRSYVPVGATVRALVLIEMALTLVGGKLSAGSAASGAAEVARVGGNTKALGMLVYTEYVYPFEIAAVILLVAIIAAIALTHRKRRDSKYQKPGEQVRVRPRDRLRVLSMPSEKPHSRRSRFPSRPQSVSGLCRSNFPQPRTW